MITLASASDVAAALRSAHDVTLAAYTLRPGAVEDALVDAARRGAHVRLRLEGRPFHDPQGAIAADNLHAVDAVRAAGGDARLVDMQGSGDAPLHAKALIADGALFLDDRNWAGDGEETILRDVFPADRQAVADALAGRRQKPSYFFAAFKRGALALEARLLASARRGDDVAVESESFGSYNRVYAALRASAKAGAAPRLLVASRDLEENLRERDALQALARDGVRIRITDADEKLALVNGRAWTGSANATAAFDDPDQVDWGMRTDRPEVVAHVRDVFERRWRDAVPFGR